ncbi:Protein phosphatase 1, regulatory subunit, and related proteins [Ceraceosorus bombacis]|uniref:Protein phosphatase 1, regulatory subunit, and related proteins n=1 Tax=Ceraceosorus bombacis TaxID=401625 RepID=A0A0P1BHK0_9BASI|nr:Protein phosphatase 1, regulatory subunit, and related proteins [Ceraceosorus bombacis]
MSPDERPAGFRSSKPNQRFLRTDSGLRAGPTSPSMRVPSHSHAVGPGSSLTSADGTGATGVSASGSFRDALGASSFEPAPPAASQPALSRRPSSEGSETSTASGAKAGSKTLERVGADTSVISDGTAQEEEEADAGSPEESTARIPTRASVATESPAESSFGMAREPDVPEQTFVEHSNVGSLPPPLKPAAAEQDSPREASRLAADAAERRRKERDQKRLRLLAPPSPGSSEGSDASATEQEHVERQEVPAFKPRFSTAEPEEEELIHISGSAEGELKPSRRDYAQEGTEFLARLQNVRLASEATSRSMSGESATDAMVPDTDRIPSAPSSTSLVGRSGRVDESPRRMLRRFSAIDRAYQEYEAESMERSFEAAERLRREEEDERRADEEFRRLEAKKHARGLAGVRGRPSDPQAPPTDASDASAGMLDASLQAHKEEVFSAGSTNEPSKASRASVVGAPRLDSLTPVDSADPTLIRKSSLVHIGPEALPSNIDELGGGRMIFDAASQKWIKKSSGGLQDPIVKSEGRLIAGLPSSAHIGKSRQNAESFHPTAEIERNALGSASAAIASLASGGRSPWNITALRQRRGRGDDDGEMSFLTNASFAMAHDRIVELIVDVAPWHEGWKDMLEIDLSGRRVESVVRLKEHLPSLQIAHLHHNELSYLTGLPENLRELHASHNSIPPTISFSHLPLLTVLDISHNAIGSLAALSGLIHLRDLRADATGVDSIEGIEHLEGLKVLSLRQNALSTLNLLEVKWRKLEKLNLRHNGLRSTAVLCIEYKDLHH